MKSLNQITSMKAWKTLEAEVIKHHGSIDLYDELETVSIEAPHGRQWCESGTATISRCRSNGFQEWTAQTCGDLLECAKDGTEPASQDTIDDMGW